MKQKFTIEKHKYLENKKSKNETMFNFKISCLMKKQVINLMMTLAIVFGLSVSAMAQNDATTNASNSRYIMITGSTHTFSITRTEEDSDIEWSLVAEASQSATGTATADDDEYTITWDENAAGNYYVQVVETRDGITCANTTRRFYINILDFDVWVYASDVSGVRLEDAALASCGDGTTANYGNETIDGATGQAFGNSYSDLNSLVGTDVLDLHDADTDGFTRRYITLGITWNTGVNAEDAKAIADLVNELAFDYTATVNNSGTPLISVNGNAGETGTAIITDNRLSTIPSTLSSFENAIAFTIPMDFQDLWLGSSYTDITYQLTANNVTLRSNDGEGPIRVLGIEPDSKEGAVSGIPTTTPYANISEVGTIQLAPATSKIGVSMD